MPQERNPIAIRTAFRIPIYPNAIPPQKNTYIRTKIINTINAAV